MTNTEIVKKIIGKILPIGETNADDDRFLNLQEMCELVNDLVTEIDFVAYNYKDSHEFSVKRASDYARSFLTNTIGIEK